MGRAVGDIDHRPEAEVQWDGKADSKEAPTSGAEDRAAEAKDSQRHEHQCSTKIRIIDVINIGRVDAYPANKEIQAKTQRWKRENSGGESKG
jgi:hypothetical protein